MASSEQNLMQKASHIWKMLDELADSDPEAYKNFISKNLQEVKQEPEMPKPYTCVRTTILKTEPKELFINICSWEKVPKPQSETAPISITGGPLEEVKQDTARDFFKVTRVAVNPFVIEECSKDNSDLNLLITLVLNYLEDQHKLSLSRKFTVCQDKKYQGNPMELKHFFSPSEVSPDDLVRESISNLTPENVLSQLGKLSAGDECTPASDKECDDIKILMKEDRSTNKKLIEEVQELTEPDYELVLKQPDEKKGKRLVLRIRLPGVNSVDECKLEITQAKVHLLVGEKFELLLPLPEVVLEAQARAKFISKHFTLTVTLPLPLDT